MDSRLYNEDELIPISAIQHVMFCERQYALIHIEQLWEENLFTAEGRILHEHVDIERHEARRDFKTEYGMSIRSLQYGLIGKTDVVEFKKDQSGGYSQIIPVEFKRGSKKEDDTDRVQLCAQVLCLEDMFNVEINTGQFYYLKEHRRTWTEIDKALRKKTMYLVQRIRHLNKIGQTPKAEYNKNTCDRCSLVNICMPKALNEGGKDVLRYIHNNIKRSLREDDT